MLIYDQRNFDLHLTQLNCAIANWATIIRIICRPTQKLLAFVTGRPLILIPASDQNGCTAELSLT
jgi:predicted ArsR family transcriptional regulator